MRRVSTVKEDDIYNVTAGNRRQSIKRRESMVTPEFQMSMLKASLEEKQILKSEETKDETEEQESEKITFGKMR